MPERERNIAGLFIPAKARPLPATSDIAVPGELFVMHSASSMFPGGSPETISDAVDLTEALRDFLNTVAAANPPHELIAELRSDLNRWTDVLDGLSGSEAESLWRKARRDQPPALLPALQFTQDGLKLSGNVRFGRFHVGRGAAHGGAISLVFDEILGALVVSGGKPRARTAYLHVDFRSIVPLDTDLDIEACFDRSEGRKHFVTGRISHGEVLCAEAEGLWVELKPGQL